MVETVPYDEFGLFHENAAEYGLPYSGPPQVRRESAEVAPGRRLSALVWGTSEPELVLLHGGSQNAHTWDTVAMALGRPLVAVDLPGHGHSDGPGDRPQGQLSPQGNAEDVAAALRTLAPQARAVVGMSLGGLTTIALTAVAPQLVRAAVLVDVTPGVSPVKAKQITDFVNGPPSFPNFEELLARTVQFNPTRSVSSLRRGILHNALQREDGSWVWRWARWREGIGGGLPSASGAQAGRSVGEPGGQAPGGQAAASEAAAGGATAPMFGDLWEVLGRIQVPLLLARGMLPQSVVGDDDEAELLRHLPAAKVVHFDKAGHSLQGDMPVELAAEIETFVFG